VGDGRVILDEKWNVSPPTAMGNCFHKILEKNPGVVPWKDSGQRTRVVEENISGFLYFEAHFQFPGN
jgi:hypothetical protein